MTRIACLTPNWHLDWSIFPTDTLHPPRSFPIEWGYMATNTTQAQLYIVDAYATGESFNDTADQLSRLSPKVVVVSTTPSYLFWRCPPLNLVLVKRYVKLIRKTISNVTVILIGPHGTIDPKWALDKTGADYVFRGEPDLTLTKLLDGDYREAVKGSPHVASAESEGVVAPQFTFEEIGSVDYSLMKGHRYRPHSWGKLASKFLEDMVGKAALIESSRGCSFNCPFCLRTGFRNKYRTKPLESVKKELDQLSELGVRYVYFIDETFGLSWTHARQVIELLSERNINYGLQTRPDLLNDAKIDALRATGCVYAEVGVEANEKDWLTRLNKFSDLKTVYSGVEKLQQTIPLVNNNILDLTNEDYFDSITTITSTQVDNSGNPPPPFMPYPSTPFGDKAISYYRALNEPSWEVGEDLFVLYSLISRYPFLRKLFLRRRGLRRILRRGISYFKTMHIAIGDFHRSRFESLYDQDIGS